MKSRSSRNKIDWLCFSLYLSLVFIGWLMIYAVDYVEGENGLRLDSLVGKQGIFIVASFLLMLIILNIDWKFWRTFWLPIYGIGIFSLLAVLVFGFEVKGAKSWFQIGPFTLQPSEFVKFATILAVSNYLASPGVKLNQLKQILISIAFFALPMLLIFFQPDAGSALVYLGLFAILYRAGMSVIPFIIGIGLAAIFVLSLLFNPIVAIAIFGLISLLILVQSFDKLLYWILSIIGLAIASLVLDYFDKTIYALFAILAFLIILFVQRIQKGKYRIVTLVGSVMLLCSGLSFATQFVFNNFLEPHQQERLNVWLHPERCDPQGALYNVLLSKIAIGSGGFAGKGYLKGNLTKLNYVPEQSTDFIFCTVGEEQGFVGSFLIIALFFFLLYRILQIAERHRLHMMRYYGYGVFGVIFLHVFINIGMTMGIFPIIGIPLPFVSYGGSSLLSFTLMVGVLLKFDSQRGVN